MQPLFPARPIPVDIARDRYWAELAHRIQGLLIHPFHAHRYAVQPGDDAERQLQNRSVHQVLSELLAIDPRTGGDRRARSTLLIRRPLRLGVGWSQSKIDFHCGSRSAAKACSICRDPVRSPERGPGISSSWKKATSVVSLLVRASPPMSSQRKTSLMA